MSTTPVKIEVVQPKAPSEDYGRPLSESERACLDGLFAGKSNLEIAASLGQTVPSVKNHFRSIYRKFGIHSVRGLFPWVIAGGKELRTGELIEGVQ